MKKNFSKLLALYLPYLLLGLAATNFGEAWRLAEGKEMGDKILFLMGTIPVAFANPLPSLHPLDILVGICCGAGLRLAVYLKSKNAKKYRHGMEYGSARWGNAKDIEPFQAPKFEDNIILTKTERLMMSNRPPDPKNARNKNVLVVGGSGSGKTRFFIKPNLLQCDSKAFPVSFVVTDPKGRITQTMLFPLETSMPTAFMIFPPLLCICNRNPSFTRCRFNLLGDTNAPLGGGSTCLKRMLQQERWRTVFLTDVKALVRRR